MLFNSAQSLTVSKSCGKLFHTRGAATKNRRPPNTVLQRGTVSRSWVDERSKRVGWYVCSVSERYCGWFSVRDQKQNADSLNWILECTGNQCKWWSCCEEDICWLPVPQVMTVRQHVLFKGTLSLILINDIQVPGHLRWHYRLVTLLCVNTGVMLTVLFILLVFMFCSYLFLANFVIIKLLHVMCNIFYERFMKMSLLFWHHNYDTTRKHTVYQCFNVPAEVFIRTDYELSQVTHWH